MVTIKKHLDKAKRNKDTERVGQLDKVLRRGTLTLDEWRFSSRFIKNSKIKNKDCVEVIEYIGDIVIEITSEGEFVYNDIKNFDLEKVENEIWKVASEKFWCETC